MPVAPYDSTFWRDGELCFLAEVPALAHIGRRFDELSESSFHYVAPDQELRQWRQLAGRLEHLVAETGRQFEEPWEQVEKRLEQEFGDAFIQARGRIPPPVQEYFQTRQMPLAEYVEWLLLGTEQQWALNGGCGEGLDMDAFLARTDRLSKRLRSAGYESEVDRRMRQEDPDRYQFMTKSMELLLRSMDDTDPHAHENMVVEQMKLFRESPMFEQAQQAQNQLRQQLERLRETDPDLYERQIRPFDEMERFISDPAAVIQQMEVSALADAARAGSGDEAPDQPRVASSGELLFRCGRRNTITQSQIRSFQELLRIQEGLRTAIEAALREMHRWMQRPKPFSWPGDHILFPDDPDVTDTPLQCFRIEHVSLEPGGRVVLGLDTLFGHFEEHGCSILIRNGTVERYGTWDDVFGDEDPDEPAA